MLLIDELNRINDGTPLDTDAVALLCELVLNRAGRHIEFSSHVRVVLDAYHQPHTHNQ